MIICSILPTGGTWATSPITLSQEPVVQAINVTFNAIDGIEAIAMNSQTKMDLDSQLSDLGKDKAF